MSIEGMFIMSSEPVHAVPRPRRPDYFDELHLAALPTAVGLAELYVRNQMIHWQMIEVADQAASAVRELVGNAVNDTGITDLSVQWSQIEVLNLLNVRLRSNGKTVRIYVKDCATEPPTAKSGGLTGKRAGFFFPVEGGRVVWCEVVAPFADYVADVEMLKRVRARLQEL